MAGTETEAEPSASTPAAEPTAADPAAAEPAAAGVPSVAHVEPGRAAPALEVNSVWQRYPAKGGHAVVLNDISLTVPEPQFLTVVGPSGCGKSTLLRLILGSESPWKGSVSAGGQAVVHPDRSRGIVFQKYSLFPHLTVLDNVSFGLELDRSWLLQKWLMWPWYKKRHQEHQEQAMEYLKTVRLDAHAHKYPHQLSGGMQQRVAIAQAMIMKPRILLMDEPFGALDPGTREDLQLTIIETYEREQLTIFFVTHDLEEALFVGTRLLVLSGFYTPDGGGAALGAKLVMDIPTPRTPHTSDKHRGDFTELVTEVRRQGFDPEYRQHVRDFDLRC